MLFAICLVYFDCRAHGRRFLRWGKWGNIDRGNFLSDFRARLWFTTPPSTIAYYSILSLQLLYLESGVFALLLFRWASSCVWFRSAGRRSCIADPLRVCRTWLRLLSKGSWKVLLSGTVTLISQGGYKKPSLAIRRSSGYLWLVTLCWQLAAINDLGSWVQRMSEVSWFLCHSSEKGGSLCCGPFLCSRAYTPHPEILLRWTSCSDVQLNS